MFVTLCVKDGPGAEAEALRRLNEWFTAGPHDAPFPPGTLLVYTLHRDQPATATEEAARAWLCRANRERGAYLQRERAS